MNDEPKKDPANPASGTAPEQAATPASPGNVETIGADPVQPSQPAAPAAPVATSGAAASEAAAEPAPAPRPVEPLPASDAPVTTQPQPSGARQTVTPSAAMMQFSLPNLLTTARCISVFIIVILLVWPWGPYLTGALVVFGFAAFTDWLDGQLARNFNLTTDFGRMLDHIADKLLVGVTMLALCAIGLIDGLNVLAAALIVGREIAVSGLREHLGAKNVVIPASDLAKWKTTFQMVALAALMAAPLAPLESVARFTALLILWAAMAMTVVSGLQYAYAAKDAWNKE